MKHNIISYEKARRLFQEGDVLLYRGQGIFSYFIQRAGEGQYSHVSIASKHNGEWECVEFKERKGGRVVNLQRQVELHPDKIDVYRITKGIKVPYYDIDEDIIGYRSLRYDGKCITNVMRDMTGLPYGWKRIWWLAKHKLAIFRLFYNMDKLVDDTLKNLIYPVCSTTVAYSYSKCGYDLIPNKADEWSEPSDIARSALLNYLFTLSP